MGAVMMACRSDASASVLRLPDYETLDAIMKGFVEGFASVDDLVAAGQGAVRQKAAG